MGPRARRKRQLLRDRRRYGSPTILTHGYVGHNIFLGPMTGYQHYLLHRFMPRE